MTNILRPKMAEFQYDLPQELIAQIPAKRRDQSRLLHLQRASGSIEHLDFNEIPDFLIAGDVLVFNNARVVPARLKGHRKTGGKLEIFVLEGWKSFPEKVLISPSRRIRIGEVILLEDGWSLEVVKRVQNFFKVKWNGPGLPLEYIERFGKIPLPPYIRRQENSEFSSLDRDRYQTVFATNPGAVAAPTAGLHFTKDLIAHISKIGVQILYITLWVGWGTFKPVTAEFLDEHEMGSEVYSIDESAAQILRNAKNNGNRVITVGTTTTRALESWAVQCPGGNPCSFQSTKLFITPGYTFRMIDGIITNFHLPDSTLILLVSAFAGRENILNAYHNAISEKYRFYSYGDAMLII